MENTEFELEVRFSVTLNGSASRAVPCNVSNDRNLNKTGNNFTDVI
jgi:hypothetical protein